MPPASPGICRCRWKTTAGCISGENVQEHRQTDKAGEENRLQHCWVPHSLLYLNCYSLKLFYRPGRKDFLRLVRVNHVHVAYFSGSVNNVHIPSFPILFINLPYPLYPLPRPVKNKTEEDWRLGKRQKDVPPKESRESHTWCKFSISVFFHNTIYRYQLFSNLSFPST